MAQTQQAQGSSPKAVAQRPQKPQPPQKKPPGAPKQGAGGQKAAGQAAPPKKAGQPAAPTAPKARPLTGQQTRQLAKAQAGGTEAQYLQKHPGVAKHQQKIGAPAPGAPTPGAPPPGAPPPGAPGAGAGGNKTPPPPPGAAPPGAAPPPAGAPAAPPTVEDVLKSQYGSNAPETFQQNWYGDNPLTTAQAAANRVLGENLANVRARYAGSGFGTSGREALAEGQAIGDVSTNLGAQLAQLGTQVRGTDLDRLAGMFATAGQQDIQQKQIGAELNQQLANLGTGITGIGASEQAIPGADFLTTLLTNMSRQPSFQRGAQKQPSK